MTVLALVALIGLAGPPLVPTGRIGTRPPIGQPAPPAWVPGPPPRVRATADVTLRIIRAAAIRGGHSDEPHQRRRAVLPDGGGNATLIEFE